MSIKSPYKEMGVNINQVLHGGRPKDPKGKVYPERGKRPAFPNKYFITQQEYFEFGEKYKVYGVEANLLKKKLDTLVRELTLKEAQGCVLGIDCAGVLQAGHVFSRAHYSTRWDLVNVFTQCWKCNYTHGRDQSKYFLWYIDRFGLPKFQELDKKAHSISNFKDFDLQEMLLKLDTIGGE